jgi:hypothetical protein
MDRVSAEDFLPIFYSLKTPSEYIIRVLSFVGSRRMQGCRIRPPRATISVRRNPSILCPSPPANLT